MLSHFFYLGAVDAFGLCGPFVIVTWMNGGAAAVEELCVGGSDLAKSGFVLLACMGSCLWPNVFNALSAQ